MLGNWRAADGWALRRYDWEQSGTARGTLVFLTGRGDMPEKYLESLAHWHAAGWNLTGFDWRGQGGSGRLAADPTTGHIQSFATWIDDLTDFWREVVEAMPRPHVIVAHSMGGHLVLRALIEQRIAPAAVALSAPMLGFEAGPIPVSWATALVNWAAKRWPERKAWSSNEKPGARSTRQVLLTHDLDRYADEDWWRACNPELTLGPPSLHWLAEAQRSCMGFKPEALKAVQVPLLMLGTDGDQLVSPAAIRRIGPLLSQGELHLYGKEAAHELLREADPVRDDVLARIDDFFARKAVL